MRKLQFHCFPFFGILLLLGTVGAQDKLPRDISSFSNRVEMCLHFSGEEPYDKQRAKEIERNVKIYCHRLKQQNQQLRRKYAQDPKMISQLNEIEKKYKEGFGVNNYD